MSESGQKPGELGFHHFQEKSTFTYVARNDQAVADVLRVRNELRLPQVKTVVVVGSGAVEPFTIAALPGLEDATVYAIDSDETLNELAEVVKSGGFVSWKRVAEASHNPDRPNRDLEDAQKLRRGLRILKKLGSLDNLGSEFSIDGMRVDKKVADRVRFVQSDAISGVRLLHKQGVKADLVVEGFLRPNTLKQSNGSSYNAELTDAVFEQLSDDGIYLIGETGESLPDTLSAVSRSTSGKINFSSLVHVVQLKDAKFVTSHYDALSKMEDLAQRRKEIAVRRQMALRPELYVGHKVEEKDLEELASELGNGEGLVSIAIVKRPDHRITGWVMSRSGLYASAANVGNELSHRLLFSPQKPDLTK